MKIDAVKVHHINVKPPYCAPNLLPVASVRLDPGALIDNARRRGHGDERASDPRARARQHDRPVARAHKGLVDKREHLLGPARRVVPDGREWVCDI
jgi:hypothetical protein